MNTADTVKRCPNCGTTVPLRQTAQPVAPEPVRYRCPVCHFRFASEVPSSVTSVGDLESALSALVSQARVGGVSLDGIVQVLRDELAFMADFASRGRKLSIQIIDLGPSEDSAVDPLASDRREALLDRGQMPHRRP